jgi:shikimate kinase
LGGLSKALSQSGLRGHPRILEPFFWIFMNIVLIGYRASGKSTVGKRLASCLKMEFVDADDLLQNRHGKSISEMVEAHGWEYFRTAEKRIIEEISLQNHLVIAPGGGAVLDADNVTALRRKGLIIWLKADQQTLVRRMNEDPDTYSRRPTLTGKGPLEELEAMIPFREPFYQKASRIQIDTSVLDVEEVVEYVLTTLTSLNLNLSL